MTKHGPCVTHAVRACVSHPKADDIFLPISDRHIALHSFPKISGGHISSVVFAMSRISMTSRHHMNGGATSSYTQATSSHHGSRVHAGPRSSSGTNKQTSGTGNNGNILSCNNCRKPLATTVFLCKCDCVFCESKSLF